MIIYDYGLGGEGVEFVEADGFVEGKQHFVGSTHTFGTRETGLGEENSFCYFGGEGTFHLGGKERSLGWGIG
jgi:hypothetical protein